MRRGRGCRRRGRGEDVRPRAVQQPLDERAAAGHESARAAEGLAQRADADVDAVLDAQVFGHAAAARTEHAGGVGFVDHQHRVVPPRQFGQLGQRRQVAVHAEQAVGHDQPAAVAAGLVEQGIDARQSPCG